MKNTFLTFVITLFSILSVHTGSKAQGFRFGLTASPSIAWMNPSTDDYASEGSRLGFSYGLLAELLFSEQYGFASGVQISYLGGELSYPVDEVMGGEPFNELSRTYSLQVVEFPLTLKMKSREVLGVRYFGKFGLGTAIIVKATADDRFIHSHGSSEEVLTDQNIKEDISFGRASLIIGGGAEYRIGGNVSLLGGINLNNGFSNVLKGNNELSGKRKNARSNYLELSLGLIF